MSCYRSCSFTIRFLMLAGTSQCSEMQARWVPAPLAHSAKETFLLSSSGWRAVSGWVRGGSSSSGRLCILGASLLSWMCAVLLHVDRSAWVMVFCYLQPNEYQPTRILIGLVQPCGALQNTQSSWAGSSLSSFLWKVGNVYSISPKHGFTIRWDNARETFQTL